MKFIYTSLFIALILFGSCRKYGYVSTSYPVKPMLHFPDSVKRVALANRSLLTKDGKNGSVIESIFSGEIAGSDKKASAECLRAIYDRFNGWHGVQVLNSGGVNLYGSGGNGTPAALSWEQVRHLCDSLHADVLLVLEVFDSNSNTVQAALNNVVNAAVNGTTPSTAMQVRMNVNSFWRLYDPYNRQVLDEFHSTNYMLFDIPGPLQPPPPDALPRTAYQAGDQYIQRFLPTYYNVRRDMYKRGKGSAKQEFKRAFRKAEVADWQGAAEIWTSLVTSPNRKNAGRACLNLAVAYEILGNTRLALEWAQKAYTDYGDKIARDYANNLRFRLQYE